MSVLSKNKLVSLINSESGFVVTPILDNSQIGYASIDLRLGTDFKVSIQTREPVIDVTCRPVQTFFQNTYRDFGEKFNLYPNQLVLGSTFEYIRIPKTHIGLLTTRSSINRLGISINSIVQPGYSGTLTIELCNNGENTIGLITGMRIVQLMLLELSDTLENDYINSQSKYICNTGPAVSGFRGDLELDTLEKIRRCL